jgi:hypothetical protein
MGVYQQKETNVKPLRDFSTLSEAFLIREVIP